MCLPRTLTPIVFVLSLFILPISAHADYQAGLDAYNQGDYATALKEWRPLAEQSDGDAQFWLGVMYDNGRGVPQDYVQAADWYWKAAEHGHAAAQYNLGATYANGEGVPQDYTQAHMWWNLAAAQGEKIALENRKILAKKMTPAQLAEAQRLAREWLAQHQK